MALGLEEVDRVRVVDRDAERRRLRVEVDRALVRGVNAADIDGEMQPELALDANRRQAEYGFSKLTKAANTLVFPSLASGNAAYQIAKSIGQASAVGPILLGVGKPVAAMQNDATVEDIVNMTSHVVLKAQQEALRRQKRA